MNDKLVPSHAKEKNILRRGLRGVVLGMAIATTIALLLFATLLVLEFASGHPTPLPRALATGKTVVFASMLVGTLGGIASRSPRHGMNMLPSISIVATCTMVGVFMDQITQHTYTIGKSEPTYILGIIGAFIGCMIVFSRGLPPKSPEKSASLAEVEASQSKPDSENL